MKKLLKFFIFIGIIIFCSLLNTNNVYAEDDNPFYFEAKEDNAKISLNKNENPDPIELVYSIDDRVTWDDYTIDYEITLNNGEKVYFRAKDYNDTFSQNDVDYYYFKIDKIFECHGNIQYLLDETGKREDVPSFGFAYLFCGHSFYSCKTLKTAPDLPATELAKASYGRMFDGCELLKKAPELPATKLYDTCYQEMFRGCSSLEKAPELPATRVYSDSYYGMFSGCTSLEIAPELPATTLASSCYTFMFSGCTSLEIAPELPATTLASSCYAAMFSGCTSLEIAPELHATTLADSCYSSMFQNCESLTTPPLIHATNMDQSNCRLMFSGCSSLSYLPNIYQHDYTRTDKTGFYDYGAYYSKLFNGNDIVSTIYDDDHQIKYKFPATINKDNKPTKIDIGNFSPSITAFADGSDTITTGQVTLYTKSAVILYDANGATSGSLPVTSKVVYSYGDHFTVQDNTGNLKKESTKYNEIFDGWCSQPDGIANNPGTGYKPGDKFDVDKYLTLFVNWLHFSITPEEDVHTYIKGSDNGLKFVCKGSSESFLDFHLDSVLVNNTPLPISNYSIDTGALGEDFVLLSSYLDNLNIGSNYTLKLVYKSSEYGEDLFATTNFKVINQYKVRYEANGATSGTVPTDDSEYLYNGTVTVKSNTGNLVKTNSPFLGWNTKPDGKGTSYKADGTDSFQIQQYTVLYANWLSFIDNNERTFYKNNPKVLEFVCNGEFSDFEDVYIDDNPITIDNQYTAKEGSTEITLLIPYLQTLNSGSHTIKLTYNGGNFVTTDFNVTDNRSGGGSGGGRHIVPNTGIKLY